MLPINMTAEVNPIVKQKNNPVSNSFQQFKQNNKDTISSVPVTIIHAK